MAMKIKNAGFQAIVLDYGRFGYKHLGITNGGPMDRDAFCWANRLLDNNYNAAQIEIIFGMFAVQFTTPTNIAICGADLDAKLNNKPIFPWQSYFIEAHDVLSFHASKQGMIAYLAVQKGIKIQQQLASCATVHREKIGGLQHDGQHLQFGNTIAYSSTTKPLYRKVPDAFIPTYTNEIKLGYIPHPMQNSRLHQLFENNAYQLSNKSNRMGYILDGDALQITNNDIFSQGVSCGTIQLPKDGKPIVLMQDCQTMGGYPIIGSVQQTDLKKLAQSKSGTKVKFHRVNIAAAESDLKKHLDFFGIALCQKT